MNVIDTKSPLLLPAEAIQAPVCLPGVAGGQGWRDVDVAEFDHFPEVVRFVAVRETEKNCVLLGSGTIIGIIDGEWLVVCTANHVLEDIGASIGASKIDPLSHLDGPEEKIERKHDVAMLEYLRCCVHIPELKEEIFCPVNGVDWSSNSRYADTALALVRLPPHAKGKARALPIDIGPPPFKQMPLLVAGFNGRGGPSSVLKSSPGISAPKRRLVCREGFLGGFGAFAGRSYEVAHLLVPIDGGMSGGPVIIFRPSGLRAVPVLVAVTSGEIETDSTRSKHVEGSGSATPAIALFANPLHLPDETVIDFKTAVSRGYIRTFGPEVNHVSCERGVWR